MMCIAKFDYYMYMCTFTCTVNILYLRLNPTLSAGNSRSGQAGRLQHWSQVLSTQRAAMSTREKKRGLERPTVPMQDSHPHFRVPRIPCTLPTHPPSTLTAVATLPPTLGSTQVTMGTRQQHRRLITMAHQKAGGRRSQAEKRLWHKRTDLRGTQSQRGAGGRRNRNGQKRNREPTGSGYWPGLRWKGRSRMRVTKPLPLRRVRVLPSNGQRAPLQTLGVRPPSLTSPLPMSNRVRPCRLWMGTQQPFTRLPPPTLP